MNTLITHSGKFHADDVFAVATFLLAHPNDKWIVERTRDDVSILNAQAVIDVGGTYSPFDLRFDHHQSVGAGVRENGIPYAAFGLVWKEFGSVICGGDFFVAKQIDDVLVSPIDANDNGLKIYEENGATSPFEISQYIHAQNLTWKEELFYGEKSDNKRLEDFLKLVDFASGLILREIKRYKDKNEAYNLVKGIYESSSDKSLIVLEQYYPWKDVLTDYEEPLIVAYPTDGGKRWAAEVVPKSKKTFEARILFPEDWSGLRDENLQNTSGVSDAIFCHRARFLVIAASRDGAISLAKKALSLSL